MFYELLSHSLILCIMYVYKVKYFTESNQMGYRLVGVYMCVVILGFIRGLLIADNYWEYKNCFVGFFCASLPLSVYVFSSKEVLQRLLSCWFHYYIPIWLMIGIWIIYIGTWHFYISPILILGCFIPIIQSKTWRLIFFLFLVAMLLGSLGDRAQILKALAVLLLAVGIKFRSFIPLFLLKIVHIAMIVAPILLLVLGIRGVFNIFEYNSEENKDKYVQTIKMDGKSLTADASADTRTFIYNEVITSAIVHDYVLFGRSLARGNDSLEFGEYSLTGKCERYMNEVSHPNIFTWLGLLGVIPWCLIFVTSSWLALYRSRNVFMKYIGVFIAFRFLLGWIEDVNTFTISGLSIWMLIAVGLSEQFRNMTDKEFKTWVNGCLSFNKKRKM